MHIFSSDLNEQSFEILDEKKKSSKKRPGNPDYYKGTKKSNVSMSREIKKCEKRPMPKSCYDYWSADKEYDKSKKSTKEGANLEEMQNLEEISMSGITSTLKKLKEKVPKLQVSISDVPKIIDAVKTLYQFFKSKKEVNEKRAYRSRPGHTFADLMKYGVNITGVALALMALTSGEPVPKVALDLMFSKLTVEEATKKVINMDPDLVLGASEAAASLTSESLDDCFERVIQEVLAVGELNEAKKKKSRGISAKVKKTLKKKAENANMPLGALTSVYRKGLAAWLTGHRQGIPQHAWAMARVNSFIRGGKTRSVDKGEWKKVQQHRK